MTPTLVIVLPWPVLLLLFVVPLVPGSVVVLGVMYVVMRSLRGRNNIFRVPTENFLRAAM